MGFKAGTGIGHQLAAAIDDNGGRAVQHLSVGGHLPEERVRGERLGGPDHDR